MTNNYHQNSLLLIQHCSCLIAKKTQKRPFSTKSVAPINDDMEKRGKPVNILKFHFLINEVIVYNNSYKETLDKAIYIKEKYFTNTSIDTVADIKLTYLSVSALIDEYFAKGHKKFTYTTEEEKKRMQIAVNMMPMLEQLIKENRNTEKEYSSTAAKKSLKDLTSGYENLKIFTNLPTCETWKNRRIITEDEKKLIRRAFDEILIKAGIGFQITSENNVVLSSRNAALFTKQNDPYESLNATPWKFFLGFTEEERQKILESLNSKETIKNLEESFKDKDSSEAIDSSEDISLNEKVAKKRKVRKKPKVQEAIISKEEIIPTVVSIEPQDGINILLNETGSNTEEEGNNNSK